MEFGEDIQGNFYFHNSSFGPKPTKDYFLLLKNFNQCIGCDGKFFAAFPQAVFNGKNGQVFFDNEGVCRINNLKANYVLVDNPQH